MSFLDLMTKLYPGRNEQRGGKGAVPVTNIDFFSRKSSLPTGSIHGAVAHLRDNFDRDFPR